MDPVTLLGGCLGGACCCLSHSAQESGATGWSASTAGGENPVIAGEIGSWSRYQSRKLGQDLQRFEDELRGAVLEGVFQFIYHFLRAPAGSRVAAAPR